MKDLKKDLKDSYVKMLEDKLEPAEVVVTENTLSAEGRERLEAIVTAYADNRNLFVINHARNKIANDLNEDMKQPDSSMTLYEEIYNAQLQAKATTHSPGPKGYRS